MARTKFFPGSTRYFVIFILSFSLISSFGIAPTWAQSDSSLKTQFEDKLSEFIGVAVKVDDYRLEYTTIHLSGISIGDQKSPDLPNGRIERLSATCDFMSLLGGQLILNDISLATMSISLTRSEKGSFFPQKTRKTANETSEMTFADLPFVNLSGKSILVKVSDQSAKRFINLNLPEIKLSHSKGSDLMSAEISVVLESGPVGKQADGSSKFSGHLNLTGKLNQPLVSGKATIEKLKIENPALKQPVAINRGTFKISGNKLITDDLSGSWGHSLVSISAKIENFNNFDFSLSFKADPIILEEFSQAFVNERGVTFSGRGSTSGTISGSKSGFKLNGSLKWPLFKIIAPISEKGSEKFVFPFAEVFSNYFYDGKEIAFKDASAKIFAGLVRGSGRLNYHLNQAHFSMDLNGTGLRAEQFLGENTTQKNVVSGPVDVTFKAKGDSSGLSSMFGSGSLKMKNGRYQAPPVVTFLLSMVNLKEFSSGEIESGQGSFLLQKGILHTQDLVFVAAAGKIYYRGQVGLDTTLKGKLNMIFAEEAVQKSQALQQISLDGKSANVPSNVEGTLLAPVFPGFSAEKLLELGLKRTGQKILIDILSPRKKDQPDESAQPAKKDPKKILKDLQKIFKF
jgi:hypothetical protein